MNKVEEVPGKPVMEVEEKKKDEKENGPKIQSVNGKVSKELPLYNDEQMREIKNEINKVRSQIAQYDQQIMIEDKNIKESKGRKSRLKRLKDKAEGYIQGAVHLFPKDKNGNVQIDFSEKEK